MKYISEFDKWCKQATHKIKYRPDRQEVYGELYQHIEDRYLDFLEQGMKPEDAQLQALKVMGEPKEIAPMLAAIHRPFWGYMYSLCKWICILLVCFTFLKMLPWLFSIDFNYQEEHNIFSNFNPFTETSHLEQPDWKREQYMEPMCSAYSNGYTFTVTKAAVWKTPEYSPRWMTGHMLFAQVKVTNPNPLAEFADIGNYFWAEDSLGNYYYSEAEEYYTNLPTLFVNAAHTGPRTYTWNIATWNYTSMEAEWIELHYDRAGRDIVLRIDLTGGDTP